MRWDEVREQFPNEWIVCEALKSRLEEGYWLVDEVAVIDRFDRFRRCYEAVLRITSCPALSGIRLFPYIQRKTSIT